MSAHTLVTTDDAHTLETDFEVPAPRIIMLTGRPGVGKTTIVRAALDAWTANGRAAAGFHTREELRDDGRRAGFEIVAADGRRASLARREARGGKKSHVGRVGQFKVNTDAVRDVAMDALKSAGGDRLLVLDEIGRMELLCEGFDVAARDALDASRVGIATVPSRAMEPFVAAVKARADVLLLEVTRENRDALLVAVRDALARNVVDAAALRAAADAPPREPATAAGPLGDAATATRLLLGETASPDGPEPYGERSFWAVLAQVWDLPESHADRVAVLRRERLVVWDVHATLHGAKPPVPNDLGAFLARHPSIGLVLLNGGAARAFSRLRVETDASVVALPSSSPRDAGARARAVAAWRDALEGA